MAQHVDDVIGFIEQVAPQPVDLMGHSVAGTSPSAPPSSARNCCASWCWPSPAAISMPRSIRLPCLTHHPSRRRGSRRRPTRSKAGDVDGALRGFVDGIDGEGAWARLAAAAKQQLRDNVFTLIGQVHETRRPYSLTDVQAIRTPTLFVGGGDTQGSLAAMHRVLAPHVAGSETAIIAGARHWMFEQAPREYCRVVLDFLAK